MSELGPSDDLDRWRLHVAEGTGNQMSNAHTELMNRWPSAYALSRATGVPYTTAKRWRRRKCISDPAYWIPLIRAAGMEPMQMCYQLARDYGVK